MDVFLTGPYERVLPRHNLSPRTTHLRQRKWWGLDIEGIKSGSFQSVCSAQAYLWRSWYECRLTRGTKWRGRCPSTLLQRKLLFEACDGGMLSPFLKTRINYQYINYLVRRYTNTVKYSIKSWNICDTEWASVRDLTQARMRLTKAWHFWRPVDTVLFNVQPFVFAASAFNLRVAKYKVTMTKEIPATMVKGRNKTVGDKDVCTLIGQTNNLVIMYVIK